MMIRPQPVIASVRLLTAWINELEQLPHDHVGAGKFKKKQQTIKDLQINAYLLTITELKLFHINIKHIKHYEQVKNTISPY